MMTKERAAELSAVAAEAVFQAIGKAGFGLLDVLERRPAWELGAFVAADRSAPAEALYRYAMQGQRDAAQWPSVPAAVRVGCEIFRASMVALLALADADAEVAAERARAQRSERRLQSPLQAVQQVPQVVAFERRLDDERARGGRPAKRGSNRR